MVCSTLCCMTQMDQANSCVDSYSLEILRLFVKLRQHSIKQQEILGAFYEFIESESFDPAKEKHLGLQAAVAALELSLELTDMSKVLRIMWQSNFEAILCLP